MILKLSQVFPCGLCVRSVWALCGLCVGSVRAMRALCRGTDIGNNNFSTNFFPMWKPSLSTSNTRTAQF